jgi:hypothetical protein
VSGTRNIKPSSITWRRKDEPTQQLELDAALNELLEIVAERSPDFYGVVDGKLGESG